HLCYHEESEYPSSDYQEKIINLQLMDNEGREKFCKDLVKDFIGKAASKIDPCAVLDSRKTLTDLTSITLNNVNKVLKQQEDKDDYFGSDKKRKEALEKALA
ncbi:MAG: hypothetical protein CW691_10400, partial [Candidatus Bathyarchaeum sp.]